MIRFRSSLLAFSALASALGGCMGAVGGPATVAPPTSSATPPTPLLPGTQTVAEVQARGLAQTAVGKNKCNPKTADRPFVIEWDATDMSSFESRAANDVVFVKYEGCDLQIVDGCSSDSERGSFGSYKPVEWTSGSVESLDINNDADLYAKLPLGIASLGGRVAGGEKFHMEYFVSGTRTATREAVHRGDIARVAACKDATHYVYAYNLGAFALGSQSGFKATAGVSVWGAGVGGSRSSGAKAEKTGGVLGTCRGITARDTTTCRVPIRLSLREIAEGSSPDAVAARAAETPTAKNLAGKLLARTDREHKAQLHVDAARLKFNSKDGRGCLDELDQHDKLDPRPEGLSTNSGSYNSYQRAQCLMQAGECDEGKVLYRKWMEKNAATMGGAGMQDMQVDSIASMYCQGAEMSPRDQLLAATHVLQFGGGIEKKTAAECKEAYETVKKLVPVVKPNDSFDVQVTQAGQALKFMAPMCFVRAGDCDGAYKVYVAEGNAPGMFFVNPNNASCQGKVTDTGGGAPPAAGMPAAAGVMGMAMPAGLPPGMRGCACDAAGDSDPAGDLAGLGGGALLVGLSISRRRRTA